MSAAPKVSVAFIAYNQRRFVSEAMDGVLKQTLWHDLEVVVGDDASSDGTREVLCGYAQRHPEHVRMLDTPQHLGMIPNVVRILRACRGDYVALLEGDDYWTEPEKLARQAKLLDEMPDLTLLFHDALRIYDGGERRPHPYCKPGLGERVPIQELLHANVVPTCSAVFRRRCIENLPQWYEKMSFGDWPLHLIAAAQGGVGFIDARWAVYRVHSSGMWSVLSEREKRVGAVMMYREVADWLRGGYRDLISMRMEEEYFRLARLELSEWRPAAALRWAGCGVKRRRGASRVSRSMWLRCFVRILLIAMASPLLALAKARQGEPRASRE